jgi:hypothetical protein
MCSDFPRGPSEDCTMFCPARELVRPYAARAFAESFHRSRRREANGGGCRADSVVPWTHSHTLLPQSHRTTSQSGYFTFTLLFLKLNHFIPGAIFLLSLNSWIVSLSSTHLACRWNVEKWLYFISCLLHLVQCMRMFISFCITDCILKPDHSLVFLLHISLL